MKSPSKLISLIAAAVHHIILTDADTFNSCNAHVSLHIKLNFFSPSSCVFLAQKFPLDEFSFCFAATRAHTHTHIIAGRKRERDEFNQST
jgi:hypothetical protein